jgi:hypothetical protein
MAKVWEYESKGGDALAQKVAKDPSIVMTNPEMAKYLIGSIKHTAGEVWLEPAKGSGAFYDNFPADVEKLYCEINEGVDFLTYDKEVDVIISNPPFVPRKLFWEFMQKSMQLARKNIYWLINMGALNVFTPKRLLEMKEAGWFIQHFNIVSDKRWFGRYVFIKIGKTDADMISWKEGSF